MKEIRGDAKSIRGLLANTRYGIDYYQREYRWRREQVGQLWKDLERTFDRSYGQQGGALDARQAPPGDRYFLGSIIISETGGARFIVDGQQRLTTVTLILIALHHRLSEGGRRSALAQLIYSHQAGRGEEAFNLFVEDRLDCMEALFRGGDLDVEWRSESAANMVEQYRSLEEDVESLTVPPQSDDAAAAAGSDPERLPRFADWLMDSVYFVEVTTAVDADAYAIFETMNDRGLPLPPVDLLKSYLLSHIDRQDRDAANETWKDQVAKLHEIDPHASAWAIKSWLWGQYARSEPEDSEESDWDLIESAFHHWLRDNRDRLGLHAAVDFRRFIERDFTFYGHWYKRIREASEAWTTGLESVYRNELSGLRDREELYLAPLVPDEDVETSLRKIRTVAAFVEFLVARRVWHGWNYNYGTMYGRTERLIVEIRRRPAAALVDSFAQFEGLGWDFTDYDFARPGLGDFTEHWPGARADGGRHRGTHRFLARVTEFIEVESGMPSRFKEYVRMGRDGYDVEHIWANHWTRHKGEIPQRDDFSRCRNNIAGLVLLPHSVNIKLSDAPYRKKRQAYAKKGQNLLARSLAIEPAEEPGFQRFVKGSFLGMRPKLPFEPHSEFKLADLQARGKLYGQLAKLIWSLDNIRKVASS